MPTRRELIQGVVALGVAGAGVPAAAQADGADSTKPIPSDGQLIGGLVEIELLVAYVYGRAVGSSEPGPRTKRLARQLVVHENAHAGALAEQLRRLGAAAPLAPQTPAAAQAGLAPHHLMVDFGRPRSAKDWVRLLLEAENVLERNYHTALSQLRRVNLLNLCAEIYGSEAQHSALLLELLHPGDVRLPAQNPFVTGG